jgi:DNA-3-methyladenine glycosylase I
MTRRPSIRPDATEPPLPTSTTPRCGWASGSAAMVAYHDTEWGTPQHDDRRLFELLTLEGAQAGLSWRTILDRRDEYRRAFHDFDIARVAAMTDAELEEVLRNSGVIRNRMKVFSVRTNARAALAAIAEHSSLDAYLWSFVGGNPVVNRWQYAAQVPASTEASDRMSKVLRKAGFGFVGSTICYAFMQATGMVDDHLASCFRARSRA